MIRLTREPIDLQSLQSALVSPPDGALVVFEGIVRNHARGRKVRRLEYQAYEAMALRQLEEIDRNARETFSIRDMAIVHRLGSLEVGECSVAIVVVSAHRGPAFEACRFAIDTDRKSVV